LVGQGHLERAGSPADPTRAAVLPLRCPRHHDPQLRHAGRCCARRPRPEDEEAMSYDPNFPHSDGGLDPSAHEADPERQVDDEAAVEDLDQIHAVEGGTAGEVHEWDRDRPLLDIEDLDITFTTSGGDVPAVRGANLTVYPG